ncbi:LHFPL tetraspan subfamily member 2a protein [Araneus ventricosus]|uniref:LHFPL tetraspan subfamily member 2a protein n=1 Tax=Araneus ventricosus TaxID=182803 RepID=A0A4Y2N6Z3_ARAVE|nr:LHFPL tetraspan subfamily member 2a protein [Araneus ventricosus]GBN33950.1 LHFPL tetraspan subfamily member 2a protein [Araneus ventricosus]
MCLGQQYLDYNIRDNLALLPFLDRLRFCFRSALPDEACHVRRMCYMIVTSRTLLWTLLTMATTLAMVAAVITPTWLIGPSRRLRGRNKASAEDEIFTPSLGLYNGCIKVHEIEQLFTENCAPFVTSFSMSSEDFPNFWKAALVLFVCGLGLLSFTLLTSLSCCCIRSVFRKSVFTVSGTIQAIAGILFLLGLVLYPAGWGSRRIQMVCSNRVGPYYIGDCSIGWTYYLAIVGTVVTFICSILSIQAEVSTSSTKVQEGLIEGKNVICLI